MKASGKELDPRCFDEREKAVFDISDLAEWQSWIKNQVVEVVPPEREGHPKIKDFSNSSWLGSSEQRKELGKVSNILAKVVLSFLAMQTLSWESTGQTARQQHLQLLRS